MSKIIVLRGLPGSGKSTWAHDFIQRNKDWIRINKDDLRSMLHNSVWSKDNEKIILDIRNSLIENSLSNGINVIVDDTNFASKHITDIMELANKHRASFEVKDFDVPLDECLKRNAERSGKARVPDKVIIDMYERYVLPEKPKLKQNPELPKCIVVDLDGTLAIHLERHPFEFMKCYTDGVNTPVLECVKAMLKQDYRLIFVSGREDCSKDETVRWLKDKCNLFYFDIHMRKTGDNRKDSLVKEEIYKEHILPNFYVEFVLDDRKQVVDHMRELGLVVFQVAPGNF
jgi:predicted kinase